MSAAADVPNDGAAPPVFVPSPLDEWPAEDEEELLQLVEFGRRIKRTPRQVHNLCDAGCPTRMRGDQRFVPWPRGLHWVIERRVADGVARELAKRRPAAAAGGDAPGVDGLAVVEAQAREQIARADKAQAEAERAILSVQKERGEVMLVDDAVRLLEDKLRPLRAVLQNFPSRWATELLGLTSVRELRAKLDVGVREAMRLLAGTTDEATAPDPPPGPAPGDLHPPGDTEEAPAPRAQRPTAKGTAAKGLAKPKAKPKPKRAVKAPRGRP